MAMLFSSCPCTSIGPCSPWGTSPWLLSKFAVLCQPQHLEHLYRSKSLHAIFIHISWLQMLGIQKPTCLDCIPQKWEDFPEDRLWMRLVPWWNYLPTKFHNLTLTKSNGLSVNRYYITDLGREHTRTCQYQRGRNSPLSCRDSRWKPARQVRRGFGNPGPDLYNVIRNWCQVHWSPLVRSAFGQINLTLQAGWPYIQVITRYSWFWLRPPKNWTCIRQDLTFVGSTVPPLSETHQRRSMTLWLWPISLARRISLWCPCTYEVIFDVVRSFLVVVVNFEWATGS